jgi:hypothetical protein
MLIPFGIGDAFEDGSGRSCNIVFISTIKSRIFEATLSHRRDRRGYRDANWIHSSVNWVLRREKNKNQKKNK